MLSGPCCCRSLSICPAGALSTSCMSDNIAVLPNQTVMGGSIATNHIFVNFPCQKYTKYLEAHAWVRCIRTTSLPPRRQRTKGFGSAYPCTALQTRGMQHRNDGHAVNDFTA